MTAKRFKDRGFRLACLDALFDMGKLKRERKRVEAIPYPDTYSETICEPRLKALNQIALTPTMLSSIKSLGPDGGDDIYPCVMEYWNGTQSDLYIKSFQDLKLLPNLKSLWVFAVAERHSLDLSLLTKHKKLKEVSTTYTYLSRDIDIDKAVADLKQRGVTVTIRGKP